MPSDAQLLYEYLGQKIAANPSGAPAAEVLADLQAYGEQLAKLRTMVSEAQHSIAQGDGQELDVAAMLTRLRQQPASGDQA